MNDISKNKRAVLALVKVIVRRRNISLRHLSSYLNISIKDLSDQIFLRKQIELHILEIILEFLDVDLDINNWESIEKSIDTFGYTYSFNSNRLRKIKNSR